jgi:hypothetical protein
MTSPPDNLDAQAVEKVLRTLDRDLATMAVFSGISMKLDSVLKTLIVVSDISYFRTMQKEMLIPPAVGELSAVEIKKLLKQDGWLL